MIKICEFCGKPFDDTANSTCCSVPCGMGLLLSRISKNDSAEKDIIDTKHAPNFKDITGQKFGDLEVLRYSGKDKNNHAKWLCVCQCGKELEVSSSALLNGRQKSCSACQNRKGRTTHGESNTRLYKLYRHIKQRCYYQKDKRYKDYGGRGITMCDDWKSNYLSFSSWARSHGYSDDLSIDRINVDGNYEPDNCRWIPLSEQSANRRPFNSHKSRDQSLKGEDTVGSQGI